MAEGWVNRFDDCTYQWEQDGHLIPVIVLVPAEALAPVPAAAEASQVLDAPPMPPRLVREGEYKPVPVPHCVTVVHPPLVLGMADAAEFAAMILRQIELGARRGDLRLLNEIQGISFLCDKIAAKVKQKKKPKW